MITLTVPPQQAIEAVLPDGRALNLWAPEEALAAAAGPRPRPAWLYALAAGACALIGAVLSLLRTRWHAAQERHIALLVDRRTLELREAARKLEVANQRLEEANRAMEKRIAAGVEALHEAGRMAACGQMVVAVAHEVRHPIFALQAAAHVLQERLAGRDEVQAQLRILGSETRRIDTLMTDLLEFTRPAEVRLTPVEPAELFSEAIEVFRDEGYDVPVVVVVNPGTPRIVIDRFQTLLAVLNLMRNAVQHAAGLTRITLTAQARSGDGEGGVRLTVGDDGAGVGPAELPRLFAASLPGARGTGFGLAIVRRIMASHAGSASVESQPGRGSAFHMDFTGGSGSRRRPARPPAVAVSLYEPAKMV